MLIFNLEVSEWLSNIAAAGSWLQSVFEGLVVHIFDNWLLSGFICTIIVLIAVCIVIDFIQDFTELSSNHIFYKMRKSAIEQQREQKRQLHLSEAEERYQVHKEQNRAEAEERYRQNAIIKAEEEAKKRLSFYDDDGNFRILSYKEQKELSSEKQRVYQKMLENYVKSDV